MHDPAAPYGFDASEGLPSDATDKLLSRRRLAETSAEGVIRKLAAYVIQGINMKEAVAAA